MFSNPPQNNNFIFAELFIPTLTLETYEQTLLQYSTPNNNNYNKIRWKYYWKKNKYPAPDHLPERRPLGLQQQLKKNQPSQERRKKRRTQRKT